MGGEYIDHKEEEIVAKQLEKKSPTGLDQKLFSQLAQKYAGEQGADTLVEGDKDEGEKSYDLYAEEIGNDAEFQTFIQPFVDLAEDADFGKPFVEYIIAHEFIEWADVEAIADELSKAKERAKKNKQELFTLVHDGVQEVEVEVDGNGTMRKEQRLTGEMDELLTAAKKDGTADIATFFANQEKETRHVREAATKSNEGKSDEDKINKKSLEAMDVFQGAVEKELTIRFASMKHMNADIINNVATNLILKHMQDVQVLVNADREKGKDKKHRSFTAADIDALYAVNPLTGTDARLKTQIQWNNDFVKALTAHDQEHLDVVPVVMEPNAFLTFAKEQTSGETVVATDIRADVLTNSLIDLAAFPTAENPIDIEASKTGAEGSAGAYIGELLEDMGDNTFWEKSLSSGDYATLNKFGGDDITFSLLVSYLGKEVTPENITEFSQNDKVGSIGEVLTFFLEQGLQNKLEDASGQQMSNGAFVKSFMTGFFTFAQETIVAQKTKAAPTTLPDALGTTITTQLNALGNGDGIDATELAAARETLAEEIDKASPEEVKVMTDVMAGLKKARDPDMRDQLQGFAKAFSSLAKFFGSIFSMFMEGYGEFKSILKEEGMGDLIEESANMRKLRLRGGVLSADEQTLKTNIGEDFVATIMGTDGAEGIEKKMQTALGSAALYKKAYPQGARHHLLTSLTNLTFGATDGPKRLQVFNEQPTPQDQARHLTLIYTSCVDILKSSWKDDQVPVEKLSDDQLREMVHASLVKGNTEAGVYHYEQVIKPTLSTAEKVTDWNKVSIPKVTTATGLQAVKVSGLVPTLSYTVAGKDYVHGTGVNLSDIFAGVTTETTKSVVVQQVGGRNTNASITYVPEAATSASQ